MKLTDLRPCDQCRGAIAPHFYVVRLTQALINARVANEVLGLNQMFGGQALGLAETMASAADDAVMVMGDKDPQLVTTIFLCPQCFLGGAVDLAILFERVNAATEAQR